MFTLKHEEIEVEPGARPPRPDMPVPIEPAGQKAGRNYTILEITNDTDQENAYTISVSCANPYWLKEWFRLRSMPLEAGQPANQPSAPDREHAQTRSLRIYVPRQSKRRVMLTLQVDKKPESRAGVYEVRVTVQTDVAGTDNGRLAPEVQPVTVHIAPYHEWRVDVRRRDQHPENELRVGRVRRSAAAEVVITNAGNDWLYCALRPKDDKAVRYEMLTSVAAVAPPEPHEEHVQRVLPLRAVSRARVIRGSRTETILDVQPMRLDAPSSPQLETDTLSGQIYTERPDTVVAVDAPLSKPQETEKPATLVYCPPIPDTISGFSKAIVANAKGLVMFLIGLMVLIPMLSVAWQRFQYSAMTIQPISMNAEPKGRVYIRGDYIVGSVFDVKSANKTELPGPLRSKPVINSVSGRNQKVFITLPPEIRNGDTIRVRAQRAGLFSVLQPLLPKTDYSNEVLVGKVEKPRQEPQVIPFPPGTKATVGSVVTLSGNNLGDGKQGQEAILVDDRKLTIQHWEAGAIKFIAPTWLKGETAQIVIRYADGKKEAAGSLTVTSGDPPPPNPEITPLPPGTRAMAGHAVTLHGSGLGDGSQGQDVVRGGTEELKVVRWQPNKIVFRAPNRPAGETVDLSVRFANGTTRRVGSLIVKPEPPSNDPRLTALLSRNWDGAIELASQTPDDPNARAVKAFALAAKPGAETLDQALTEAEAALAPEQSRTSKTARALALLAQGIVASRKKVGVNPADYYADAKREDPAFVQKLANKIPKLKEFMENSGVTP